MKNRGFTLIELLAVIVILAIIALIATPIILNIIENAREEANKRSIELYASAIKNGIAAHQLRTGEEVEAGTYTSKTLPFTVEYDGDVECNTIQVKEDGTIYVGECTVNDQLVEYTYGKKIVKPCSYSDEDSSETINLSDVVTCGTESFYVMENDGSNITMLSMYNLDVGNIRDKNTDSLVTNTIENPTGIQSPRALGRVSGTTEYYGIVAFSTSEYWYDWENDVFTVDTNYAEEGRSYPYVYGDYKGSVVYPYVNAYETYLKETLKVNSASTSLMSYEQAIDLKNNQGNPSWLYNTTYWLGSASDCYYVRLVNSNGSFGDDFHGYGNGYEYDDGYGVRPVVIISVSDI